MNIKSNTPYELRLLIHRFNSLQGYYKDTQSSRFRFGIVNPEIYALLLDDVRAMESYRKQSGMVTRVVLKNRFAGMSDTLAQYIITNWLVDDRDFIYTKAGLQILINRYLYQNEPIQCAMLRFANIMSGHTLDQYYQVETFDEQTDNELQTVHIFYDLISCGMVHLSSIMAASDQASIANVMPGEACRLMVATNHYDHQLIIQLEQLCTLISLGVGVGFGISNIPRFGSVERGYIRSGLRAIAKKINACNYVTLHERRPKVALYLHIHNDTFLDIIDLKMPSKAPLENVFFGLFIPDYFMECVRNKDWWYFFSGATRNAEGKTLADYSGPEYQQEYEKWVRQGVHVGRQRARDVMQNLLKCLLLTGAPYIIWSDNVNRFNNQMHLGTIKTLNLCAEITNNATDKRSSSCTLLSCNMAMYRDFPEVLERMSNYLCNVHGITYNCEDFGSFNSALASYAFNIGYLSTLMLNRLMGVNRKYREIGINPLGVYDMALLANRGDLVNVCAIVTEALYKGAIHSSCDYSRRMGITCENYRGSHFSYGRPQWALRAIKPYSDWTNTQNLMIHGMANSMLTAQAPTATTCLLTGVSESVTLPMSTMVTKESENGRNRMIVYGEIYRNYIYSDFLPRPFNEYSFKPQLDMYIASMPFVDQSQSTMFPVNLDMQDVFNLIVSTYEFKFKTGIYYLLYRQCRPTLDVVKTTSTTMQQQQQSKASCSTTGDAANGCDSCSM
nr:ribonucleotide reductase large subunit [Apis mellifera nudivirus]